MGFPCKEKSVGAFFSVLDVIYGILLEPYRVFAGRDILDSYRYILLPPVINYQQVVKFGAREAFSDCDG